MQMAPYLGSMTGMIGSITLVCVGAYVVIRRDATTSLFADDQKYLLVAKAVLGGVIAGSGVFGFFIALADLL